MSGGAKAAAGLHAHGAASAAAWSFSQAEAFWERFKPLTPAGKDSKEARLALSEPAAILGLYDDTDAALAFMEGLGPVSPAFDRITYHLRRVPRLATEPLADNAVLELVELFQVKKFLANYRAVAALVSGAGQAGKAIAARFALFSDGPALPLAAALDLGGSDAETFHVADAYDPRLREIRRRVAALDESLAAARAGALTRAKAIHGLDFDGLDFLVLPHARAAGLVSDRAAYAVESYDDSSYIIRLQPSEAELGLQAERDDAVEAERSVENEVLARLSSLAAAAMGELAREVKALARLDLALARAALAREFGLVRPELAPADGAAPGRRAPLVIEAGTYLPCAWECGRLGLRYVPLDFRLEEGVAVVFGSNMGGKTVALETVLFLQILAQSGFFVPARRYATEVYPLVHSLGAGAQGGDIQSGLSGFGYEIRSFVEAFEAADEGAFLVLDEFARTTSSHEAEAMLGAVVEALAAMPGTRALFSTHFRGLKRPAGVRWLRVRGLDREAAVKAICLDGAGNGVAAMGDRIRMINGMMHYGLVDDDGSGPEGSDAVLVASLLGLDCRLADRAAELFEAGRNRVAGAALVEKNS